MSSPCRTRLRSGFRLEGLILGWAVILPIAAMATDDGPDPKVIPATEARNHVGERLTVEMTVRSSKNAAPRREYYLDSEADFHDEANLAVVISYEYADAFKQAGVDDPAEYYRDKSIRVTGMLIREADQVRIRVEEPKQITVRPPDQDPKK